MASDEQMPLGRLLEPIHTVATWSGSVLLSMLWASGPCLFWLGQGVGQVGEMLLCRCELCLPRGAPACLCCCALWQQKRGAGLQLTTSDVLRGNTSYFLWIAVSFISLQINLAIVGDSVTAAAGFFSAVSVARAFGSVFLTCCVALYCLIWFFHL